MNNLYPLKFRPILKEMIWGGTQIPEILKLKLEDNSKIGELYAISGLKSDNSIVKNGVLEGKSLSELINEYGTRLLGEKVYDKFGEEFPLLIKFIDANDDLSIQVHPNDEEAKNIQNGNGKTEMWYIVKSHSAANLIAGFVRPISKDIYTDYFNNGRLMDLVGTHSTTAGDTFFIPAGKVHSIGKGNLVAEIQQTSDITYRIYDFDRTDKDGKQRELHHEQALKVINFEDVDSGKIATDHIKNDTSNLVTCQYFTTNLIDVDETIARDYADIDSFVILINTGTECEIDYNDEKYVLKSLEAILLPACIDSVKIETQVSSRILEVYVE